MMNMKVTFVLAALLAARGVLAYPSLGNDDSSTLVTRDDSDSNPAPPPAAPGHNIFEQLFKVVVLNLDGTKGKTPSSTPPADSSGSPDDDSGSGGSDVSERAYELDDVVEARDVMDEFDARDYLDVDELEARDYADMEDFEARDYVDMEDLEARDYLDMEEELEARGYWDEDESGLERRGFEDGELEARDGESDARDF